MHIFSSIPSPTISFIDLGVIRIHFYALFILVGIVLATIMGNARLTKRGAENGLIIDIAFWAVPFGIVGGRIFHVLTHIRDYFGPGKDIMAVFYVWEGGLAIYGALIFGAVGAFIGCLQTGVRFLSFADAIAPGILLAQAIGRLGNYFNQELFGEPTDLPWGLEIARPNSAIPIGLPSDAVFHPTFLYELLWNLLGVIVLLVLDGRLNMRWGRLFGAYLVWYSTGRFFIEGIRIDPSDVLLGLRTNQWSALVGVLVGLALVIVATRMHTGAELSALTPKGVILQEKRLAEAAEAAKAKVQKAVKPVAEPESKANKAKEDPKVDQ
ncbi:MAG: hypothetical protein RLZZ400_642 [Actinomycetota bacterium]